MIIRGLLLFMFHLAVVCPVFAESDSSGIPWDQLTVDEQRILKPFQDRWEELPSTRQFLPKVCPGFDRHGALPPLVWWDWH